MRSLKCIDVPFIFDFCSVKGLDLMKSGVVERNSGSDGKGEWSEMVQEFVEEV